MSKTNRAARRAEKNGDDSHSPGLSLSFRSTAHYNRWRDEQVLNTAAKVISDVVSNADEARYRTLAAALQEATADTEMFNAPQAIQAMRAFFNDEG